MEILEYTIELRSALLYGASIALPWRKQNTNTSSTLLQYILQMAASAMSIKDGEYTQIIYTLVSHNTNCTTQTEYRNVFSLFR